MASRPGRRVGESGTREAVLQAARHSFATVGFARTTIRAVAAAAGVDPALVMQFHGSKHGLLRNATGLPFDPAPAVEAIADGSRSGVGARLAAQLTRIADDEELRAVLVARVRVAATEAEGAALVRRQLADDLVLPLVRRLDVDQA